MDVGAKEGGCLRLSFDTSPALVSSSFHGVVGASGVMGGEIVDGSVDGSILDEGRDGWIDSINEVSSTSTSVDGLFVVGATLCFALIGVNDGT